VFSDSFNERMDSLAIRLDLNEDFKTVFADQQTDSTQVVKDSQYSLSEKNETTHSNLPSGVNNYNILNYDDSLITNPFGKIIEM